MRDALRRYDAITNVFRPDGDTLPEPDLPRLERTVRYGWMAFQAVNYQAVGQLLADLIHDAQAAFVNAAQTVHPAFSRHVETLRASGVTVLLGGEGYQPHPPHQGSKHLHKYPWQVAIDAVEANLT